MKKEVIQTAKAPKAIGPYSQGVVVSDQKKTIFFSGQIALDPQTGEFISQGIEGETKQVLKNISALLEEVGAEFHHIIKTTIFLKSMEDFQTVNVIYGEYFTLEPPARSTVEVSCLPKNALVEIECIVVM